MKERKLNCYDCSTYHDWCNAEEYWQERLIVPPDEYSNVPDCYAYCEGAGKVVDLSDTPEDNRCSEFEKWYRRY